MRILADEAGSEIWCGVPGKCQNFPGLSMFLSSSRTDSQLVLSRNPRIRFLSPTVVYSLIELDENMISD